MENADLEFRVLMLTFVVTKGRRPHPKPPSLFFSPAFGVTGLGLGFSKPTPGFSKPSVEFFTPGSVIPTRRFVTTRPAPEISEPRFVKKPSGFFT